MAKQEDGVWRTIRGRRVFIRKGEDLESAMKRSGKFSEEDKKEDNESDNSNNYQKGKQKNIEEANEILKDVSNKIKDNDKTYISGVKYNPTHKYATQSLEIDNNTIRVDLMYDMYNKNNKTIEATVSPNTGNFNINNGYYVDVEGTNREEVIAKTKKAVDISRKMIKDNDPYLLTKLKSIGK